MGEVILPFFYRTHQLYNYSLLRCFVSQGKHLGMLAKSLYFKLFA